MVVHCDVPITDVFRKRALHTGAGTGVRQARTHGADLGHVAGRSAFFWVGADTVRAYPCSGVADGLVALAKFKWWARAVDVVAEVLLGSARVLAVEAQDVARLCASRALAGLAG